MHYDEFDMAFIHARIMKEKWTVNLKRIDGATRTVEIYNVHYIYNKSARGLLHNINSPAGLHSS